MSETKATDNMARLIHHLAIERFADLQDYFQETQHDNAPEIAKALQVLSQALGIKTPDK